MKLIKNVFSLHGLNEAGSAGLATRPIAEMRSVHRFRVRTTHAVEIAQEPKFRDEGVNWRKIIVEGSSK
jgi:hypothetical protein